MSPLFYQILSAVAAAAVIQAGAEWIRLKVSTTVTEKTQADRDRRLISVENTQTDHGGRISHIEGRLDICR